MRHSKEVLDAELTGSMLLWGVAEILTECVVASGIVDDLAQGIESLLDTRNSPRQIRFKPVEPPIEIPRARALAQSHLRNARFDGVHVVVYVPWLIDIVVFLGWLFVGSFLPA